MNTKKKIPCAHMWLLPKAASEVLLIALAVCETGAGGLGPTDAAAIQAPIHFWLVKAKHLRMKLKPINKWVGWYQQLNVSLEWSTCKLQCLRAGVHLNYTAAIFIFNFTNDQISPNSCLCEIVTHGRHSGKAIFFAGASPRFDPHGGEVGQQSDSVSDRSCHHAARTGCTVHFGNSKKHAHEAIPRAEERICSGCTHSATYLGCFLPETRGVGCKMCSAKITQNAISAPITLRNYKLCC